MSELLQPKESESRSSTESSSVLQIGRNIVQERFFFFLILAILLLLTLLLIWPNLTAILTAIALVVIIKPLYNRIFESRWGAGSPNRTTAVTIITFLLLIALPVTLFLWGAITQTNDLLSASLTRKAITTDQLQAAAELFLEKLAEDDGFTFNRDELLPSLREGLADFSSWLTETLASFAGWLVQFFTTAVVVLVIMMVLLPRFKKPDQDQMASFIPFPPDITNLYLDKIQSMIMAMFKGTFLLAILQGAAMGVVFLIADVPYIFPLTVLSMFLALLPMIGISLIAWPIAILLILNGHIWQGAWVIVAFLLIVANIDTALRPVLVPKVAYLNPALVMLSVFGGLNLIGFIGLIYGPVIMILLVTSIEVYAKYIMRSDLQPFLDADGSLNMEKLGLRTAETDASEKSGSVFTILQRAATLFTRRDPTDSGTD